MSLLTCFKAYDIRGRVPEQLNEDIAYRVGRAYVEFLQAKTVIVGHDVRLTSENLASALIQGITDSGADVLFIGECGTEEVYFGTFHYQADGGICVTASHNPMDYNGMKLVREGSRPISGDTGLNTIKRLAEENRFQTRKKGTVSELNLRSDYVKYLLSYIDQNNVSPLKVVVNAGNGGVGAIVDQLEPYLPIEFIKIHHQADGSFPNGIPNPLLPENRGSTSDAIIEHGADLGIAWDGDFDRCFFFDHKGRFVEGYYLVGLLAESFLLKTPGAKIVHDPRLTWNTIDIVSKSKGVSVQSKTGHAFIKEVMRREDAIYGGEMSAHHYFRDFAYCDNGNIPWLLLVELLSLRKKSLADLVSERIDAFPCSGEINDTVSDPENVLKAVEDIYLKLQQDVQDSNFLLEKIDGLSMSFSKWRFNLRMSSTEPVIRLNVEARGDKSLMEEKTRELLAHIRRSS